MLCGTLLNGWKSFLLRYFSDFKSRLQRVVWTAKKRLALKICQLLLRDDALNRQELTHFAGLVGRELSKLAWLRYNDHEYAYIEDGIELMERAWVLCQDADVACRLGLMYQRANRNDDAIALYRDAFRAHPAHSDLRYQAAIQVLRFGEHVDVCEHFQAALGVDPNDPFARFVVEVLNNFDPSVELLLSKIRFDSDERPCALLSFAVWGDSYIADFMRQACAALLADGNLPALARHYRPHIVVFTTSESERTVRENALFGRISALASVHFMHFKPHWIHQSAKVVEHYGDRLGPHYALNCKFLLFASAHRAALEVGRRIDALVTPMGTDNVFNDGAFTHMMEIMKGEFDVVAVTGFRLLRSAIEPTIEAKYRQPDGILRIPSDDYARLLAEHIPDNYFAHSKEYTHFPLLLCWRVSDDEVLVHSNHYHPVCIRAAKIKQPLGLTIDPVDGRFMQRNLPDTSRIHVVQDCRVALSDWGDDPLIVPPSRRPPMVNEISLWLWMCWDSLRSFYFLTPVRVGRPTSSAAWERAELEAADLVGRILAESERKEANNRHRKAWWPAEAGRPLRQN